MSDYQKTSNVYDQLLIKGKTGIINQDFSDLVVEGGILAKGGIMLGDIDTNGKDSTLLAGTVFYEGNTVYFINDHGYKIKLHNTNPPGPTPSGGDLTVNNLTVYGQVNSEDDANFTNVTINGKLTLLENLIVDETLMINGGTTITNYTMPGSRYQYDVNGGQSIPPGVNTIPYGQSAEVSLICKNQIYCASGIFVAENIIISDKRIKQNIKNLDDSLLEKFDQIEPVQYTYRDVHKHGYATNYGFIAQQLEEVDPNLIKKNSIPQFIPNIYQGAKNIVKIRTDVYSFEVTVNDQIKNGDKLKIYYIKNNKEHHCETHIEQIEYMDDFIRITIEFHDTYENNQLFIYGTEVNDVKSVSMMNVIGLLTSVVKSNREEMKTMKDDIKELKKIIYNSKIYNE